MNIDYQYIVVVNAVLNFYISIICAFIAHFMLCLFVLYGIIITNTSVSPHSESVVLEHFKVHQIPLKVHPISFL